MNLLRLPAALLLAGSMAYAAEPPRLRFAAPGAGEIPLGMTRVEVEGEGFEPGDRVELFADGRKLITLDRAPWRHVWNAGEAPRNHLLTAGLVRGGREVASARLRTASVGFTTNVTARAISLAPVVVDRSGRYVTNLTRADFTVLDEGQRQEIETFESSGPLSLALLLDVSASMALKMTKARAAAHGLLDALKPEDEVSLMTFSTSLLGATPFSRDRAALHDALDEVRTQGETALYDATAAALKRLAPLRRRKAVLLFTDGEDNRSRLSVDRVVQMARASEVSVYAVAQGEVPAGLRLYLDRLTEKTGGRSYAIADIQGLSGVYDKIVAELKSQYFLTYTPKSRLTPRTWRKVEVRAKPGLTVRVKKEYLVE